MKAVILESYVMEEGDLDWSGVKALVPDTVSYVRTAYEEIAPRIGDADIVLLNKCRMDEEILQQCPNLKWVGIIATGTDNLDLEACRRHGVAVANVPGYSTYSVAQMTFSLLLAICQCAERYNRAVKQGCWQLDIPESIGLLPQMELYGKTYGVYGYGSIGRQSARIARAFGMEVLVCTRTVRPEYAADGVEFVDYDTLLRRCDILSLHCPATPQTRGLVNAEALAKMKPGAILLNTARGALVDEEAVAAALHSGQLALAGHGHAHRGGGAVLQLQPGAHGAAALVQRGGNAHPAGLFGQCHQRGGGKHVQRAAAHGLCGVLGSNGDTLLAADSSFQHKNTSFPDARRRKF